MVTPGMAEDEAYLVEAWRRDAGGDGRDLPRRGARVHIQPPSPSLERPAQLPPPPRQQQYSWAGQEEFTASLVAEYGAMLSPFLATPGNTRPQSYENNDQGGASPEPEQSLSLMSAVQERAALLATTPPPKRVGRKLSKRRRPVPAR